MMMKICGMIFLKQRVKILDKFIVTWFWLNKNLALENMYEMK